MEQTLESTVEATLETLEATLEILGVTLDWRLGSPGADVGDGEGRRALK